MNDVHYKSKTVEWETPQDFFDELQKEFRLTVDVCATKENAKLPVYFTREDDGLTKNWRKRRCWMNPPYGREIGKWVEKAATGKAAVIVALLPARTDTRWFHRYIYQKPNVEIRFVAGRLRFGGHKNPAPFPSMIVIFTTPR